LLLPFPNPNDGKEPLTFYYRLDKPADKVQLKVYTTAFRKLYENADVPAEAGVHLYTLRWDRTGLNLANGLYYLVLIRKEGSEETRETMKLIIRR
jgi:hypothetical protein